VKVFAGLFAVCALMACSPPAEIGPVEAVSDTAEVTAPIGPITSQGVVTAIDELSVTLDHQSIDAIGWNAMTMRFSADPALLSGIAVGDIVSFELESAANPRTITKISKL
jgi:Cu(I)/Ag(I) efflux system periplasmic protein CusF